ncbi:MAG: radical SAM protein [Candidatus Brocadiales bacterium]|nr:radical SAM protein [Candidatus Brocadiales bacterium]
MRNVFLRLLNLLELYYGYYRNKFILNELVFFVTYKCNFRCKTCFYADIMDDKGTIDTVKELDIDEIGKTSSSIGKFDQLLISGGEPFLRDDLAEICEIFYLQNRINRIHLPTNGFYTEKIYSSTLKILDRCPKIHLSIGLPLDGLQETHDKIKGVKGSFEKIIETTKRLSTLKKEFDNLSTYIITVVNKTNLNEIIELAEFVKNNLPVNGHGPSPMRGSPYEKTVLSPSYEEWNVLSKELMEYYNYWNKKSTSNSYKSFIADNAVRYLYKMYTRVLKGERLPFKCQAGKVVGVLESNGDVKLCELTGVIGNVRSVNYDFRKIWFSDKGNDMRKRIKDCTCTHACFLYPSIKMNPFALINSYLFGRL